MNWDKKYFFGWTNIKWFIRELGKLGSNEPSYFSQKRVFQFIAFGVLQFGCMEWLSVIVNAPTWVTSEFLMWASVELAVCGFNLNAIQKEKRENKVDEIIENKES